jgi:methylmalonyl-CoA mutase
MINGMNEDNQAIEDFPEPTKSDWEKAAAAEIADANPMETLKWKTDDDESFYPIYTREDTKSLEYLQNFSLGENSDGTLAHPWVNMPLVIFSDEKSGNKEALHHLQQEAEGVLFKTDLTRIDFEKLLSGIYWEHCSISFQAGKNFPATDLVRFIKGNNFDLKKLHGALFHEEGGKAENHLPGSRFKFAGLFLKASSPVNEIVEALTGGLKIIRAHLAQGKTPTDILEQIAFSVPLGTQLLTDLAKLKALRILWYQITQAYGLTSYKSTDLYLHGRSEAWINQKFQPNGNMLKGTVSAIAGITGGCDAITIIPEDPKNFVMNRVARNTSLILLEEAHLGKINDPFGGAYALEVMVDQIAKEAWARFQELA